MRRIAMLAAGAASLALLVAGCGGSPEKKEEPTGSLQRKYTLMDEQGRKSGSLVINPLGGAELRDIDGKVIGVFKSATPAEAAPAETAPAKTEEAAEEKK